MKGGSTLGQVVLTFLLVGVCAGLCLIFWLYAPPWNHTVFGRYSVKWFVGSLVANAVILSVTLALIRRVWLNTCSSPLPRPAYRISPGKQIAFIMVSVALVLGMIEIGLRYLDYASFPRMYRPAGAKMNYHALLQHVDRVDRDGTPERAYRGHIYQREKTAQFRIVCLGGSTTWGDRLEREQAWPAVLESHLRDLGYDVEVINAGRGWYTTAHSLVNYSVQMRYYNPDVVVIMHGANDLARSFPVPGEPPPEWDYGSYQGPMRNVLAAYRVRNREQDWKNWHPVELLDYSALYRLLFERNDAGAEEAEAEVDVGLEAFPTIENFRSHLEYLARSCLTDGRHVVLATQANIYDSKDLTSLTHFDFAIRKAFMKTPEGAPISAESLRRAMRAVRETTIDVARTLGVPVADVERAVDGKVGHFIDDFHLNVDGNVVAAKALVDVLRPMLDERKVSSVPPVHLARSGGSCSQRACGNAEE